MKSKLALATMLAAALVAPAALPCGAPFGNGVNVDPQQDIIVVHKNGVETYVFQPRFCGSAREFGLVLPVPAKLTAQPSLAKTDAFKKLDAMSKPETRYSTVCNSRGGVGGASGGTGNSGVGGSWTTVVSSGTVGFMDYAQLDTVSVDALTAWLTQNGYPYDAQATAAFDYYVKKGWYFLTFKVDQGMDAGAGTCKDLGPIKFSFPTTVPVVPTRMASARAKDTSGTLSYGSGFSWRVFGITDGSKQVDFASPSYSYRVLGFSGLVASSDVSSLDGLAASGDRASKLTVTFGYGSTDSDVELKLATGQDYREIVYQTTYITCTDGGIDSGAQPIDAPMDLRPPVEGGPVDLGTVVLKDAAVPDTGPGRPDASASADVLVVMGPDAGAPGPDLATPVATADAAVVKRDSAPQVIDQPQPKHESSGCSFTTSSDSLLPALLIGLGLLLRRRRRS
jgi:MYXO-CTERM domain-containing protein